MAEEQTQEQTATERPSWQDQFPEELQNDKTLWGYAKPKDMVTALKESTAKATDLAEKLQAATPQIPEAYDLPKPDLPEGMTYDEKLAGAFKDLAKELKLTQEQAKKLYEWNNARSFEAFSESQAAVKEHDEKDPGRTSAELQKPENWGADFEKNVALMPRGVDWIEKAVPEMKEFAQMRLPNGTLFANSVAYAKLSYEIAQAIAEDSFVGGKSATGEPSERQQLEAAYPSMKGMGRRTA